MRVDAGRVRHPWLSRSHRLLPIASPCGHSDRISDPPVRGYSMSVHGRTAMGPGLRGFGATHYPSVSARALLRPPIRFPDCAQCARRCRELTFRDVIVTAGDANAKARQSPFPELHIPNCVEHVRLASSSQRIARSIAPGPLSYARARSRRETAHLFFLNNSAASQSFRHRNCTVWG